MRTVELLSNNDDVLAQLRREYPQILVDEYQDMNRASARLLKQLAGDGVGLWVVGDLRQAIYQFRGASPANIHGFTSDFPGGKIVSLGRNYRSDPHLVALLRAIGGAMMASDISPSDWDAFWPEEPPPRVWVAEADDESSEGMGIAAEIRRRHAAGRPYRDQAVLVRTHRQAEPIIEALTRAGIPVLHLGDLFGQEVVRDLLALISLVAEGDGSALMRFGDMEEYQLTRRERSRLIAYARQQRAWFPGALALAEGADLSPRATASVELLRAAITSVGWQTDPWQFLARYLFGHGEIIRRLLREGAARSAHRLLAIGQLLAVARAFAVRSLQENATTDVGLRHFLGYVRRLVASGEDSVRMPPGDDDVDAVRVLTIHASKGLEFPVVYVTNLAEKRFPPRVMPDAMPLPPGLGASEAGGRMPEEERLFFVAISRAKHELVLSYATRYGKDGNAPSPLLALVAPFFAATPPALLDWRGLGGTTQPTLRPGDPVLRPLDIAEVEVYLHCPRQYEYRYGFSLPERDEVLAYKRFQGCVNRVVNSLRAMQTSGTLPDEEATLGLLAAEWAQHGPCGHPHEQLYRGLAETLVTRRLAKLRRSPAGPAWRDELDTELGGTKICIRIDSSEVTAGGVIRLRRLRAGLERDEDRYAPRLALLRKAAQEALGPQSQDRD